jgi:hypothetical protein
VPEDIRKAVNTIITRWEETGDISHDDLATLEQLRHGNPDVYETIRNLMPLLRVDAGMNPQERSTQRSRGEGAHESTPIDVADSVMHEIDGERPSPRFGRHKRRLVPIAAAAAAVLLIGASILATVFYRSGLSASRTVVVRFELSAPEADSVALVGDFNDWEPKNYRLEDRDGDGIWEIEVELEEDRVYTYNFLVDDDEWIADPSAKTRVRDSFGGEKSVLNL